MTWRYSPIIIGAVFLTFIIHEGAHWAAGEALGYDMWVRINSAGLVEGTYSVEWHRQIVSAAGPLITLTQGLIGLMLAIAFRSKIAFTFVFSALMMRILAAFATLNNPNDEARISEWLGLGTWTLHGAVIIALAIMTIIAARQLTIGWRSYGFAYLVTSLSMAGIVMSEQHLPTL